MPSYYPQVGWVGPHGAVVMSVFSTDWVDMFWKKGFCQPSQEAWLREGILHSTDLYASTFASSFTGAPNMSDCSIFQGWRGW